MKKIVGIRLVADEGKILRNTVTDRTGYVVSTTEENEAEWIEVEDVVTEPLEEA